MHSLRSSAFFALAAVSGVSLLGGCSTGDVDSATAAASSDLSLEGPMHLYATCTLDEKTITIPSVGPSDPSKDDPLDIMFGPVLAPAPSTHPGSVSHDAIAFGMKLRARAGDSFSVELATLLDHIWSLPAPLVLVKKDGLHAGDVVTFHDDRTLSGRPIDCAATLKPELVTVGDTPVAAEKIATPIVRFDLPLPNQRTCGLALKVGYDLEPHTAEYFHQLMKVSAAGFKVTTTLKDSRTILFTVDVHGSWDVFLELEPVMPDTSVGEALRDHLGLPATFETVLCPGVSP